MCFIIFFFLVVDFFYNQDKLNNFNIYRKKISNNIDHIEMLGEKSGDIHIMEKKLE